ncbi:MAG: type II toxin-antitoxin system VapC family toxin [Cardiobacteriaceae bacterium]|nr:type II toxin-antitoxin system VapC family toxin [Cardiobacteriaceae bacterium]
MRCMLDTNTCIYIINRKYKQVVETFSNYKVGEVVISNITACELAFGVKKSSSIDKNSSLLFEFFELIQILPFGQEAIWHYADIRASLQRKGSPIGAMDLLIAAHARSLNLPLVTNNTREFERVEGLQLENWI